MTRLLASVANIEEAHLAFESGVDIIDLKNPAAGALGAVPHATVTAVVGMVNGACRISATLGDLPMQPEVLCKAVLELSATWVDFIKVGIFPSPEQRECIAALKNAADAAFLIGVLFADHQPGLAVLEDFSHAGFAGVMLDTADKTAGGLRAHLSDAQLRAFVERARALELFVGLAGSLAMDDVAPLMAINPDYLGFRGALCDQSDRKLGIVPERILTIRRAMDACPGMNANGIGRASRSARV
ncbi:MAG: (5-formylfuran-3-yl)methyl phosphate synthase [Burkholderiales bacterium]